MGECMSKSSYTLYPPQRPTATHQVGSKASRRNPDELHLPQPFARAATKDATSHARRLDERNTPGVEMRLVSVVNVEGFVRGFLHFSSLLGLCRGDSVQVSCLLVPVSDDARFESLQHAEEGGVGISGEFCIVKMVLQCRGLLVHCLGKRRRVPRVLSMTGLLLGDEVSKDWMISIVGARLPKVQMRLELCPSFISSSRPCKMSPQHRHALSRFSRGLLAFRYFVILDCR